MLKSILVFGAVVLTGLPVIADPNTTVIRPTTGAFLLRDSDGVVISVIHPVDYGFPGTDGPTSVVYYTFDGRVLEFSGLPVAATDGGTQTVGTPSAVVGNTRYSVESNGVEVWLIDPATGKRFATERRMSEVAPDAVGHKVNPTAFSLE